MQIGIRGEDFLREGVVLVGHVAGAGLGAPGGGVAENLLAVAFRGGLLDFQERGSVFDGQVVGQLVGLEECAVLIQWHGGSVRPELDAFGSGQVADLAAALSALIVGIATQQLPVAPFALGIGFQQTGVKFILDHQVGIRHAAEQDLILINGQFNAVLRAAARHGSRLLQVGGKHGDRVAVGGFIRAIVQLDVVGVVLFPCIRLGLPQPVVIQNGLEGRHDGAGHAGALHTVLAAIGKGNQGVFRAGGGVQRIIFAVHQAGHGQGSGLDRLNGMLIGQPLVGIGVLQHGLGQAACGHDEGDLPGDLAVRHIHVGVGLFQLGVHIVQRHHLAVTVAALAAVGFGVVVHLGGLGHGAGVGKGGVADLVGICLALVAVGDGVGPAGVGLGIHLAPGNHSGRVGGQIAFLVLDHDRQAGAGVLHVLLAALLDPVGHLRARG